MVFNAMAEKAFDDEFRAADCESVDTAIWVMAMVMLHGKDSIHSMFATFDDCVGTCWEYS